MLKIARPQEEERREKEKEVRKARAKGIRQIFTAVRAKACRHWIHGVNGVGVKEEESTTVMNRNHHKHHNHGCNFNNHPGSVAWVSAAWAIGVDRHGNNRHGGIR